MLEKTKRTRKRVPPGARPQSAKTVK